MRRVALSQADKLLSEISGKLDKMLRLLAIDTVKGLDKEQDKIGLLDELGFRPSEIARLLNKSIQNVSVQLGIIRKKREPKTKTKATDQAQTSQNGEKDITGVTTSDLQK
jgi:hypothetical protein